MAKIILVSEPSSDKKNFQPSLSSHESGNALSLMYHKFGCVSRFPLMRVLGGKALDLLKSSSKLVGMHNT